MIFGGFHPIGREIESLLLNSELKLRKTNLKEGKDKKTTSIFKVSNDLLQPSHRHSLCGHHSLIVSHAGRFQLSHPETYGVLRMAKTNKQIISIQIKKNTVAGTSGLLLSWINN